MKGKSVLPALAGVIVILAACVWGSTKISAARSAAQRAASGSRSNAVPVRTALVELGKVENVLTFNGDVEALRTVDLQAKVSGRLVSMELSDGTSVEEGTAVLKGEEIARLDDREYTARLLGARAATAAAVATRAAAAATLEQRKASLSSAEANLEDKRRECERMRGLVKQQAGTQQSLDQAETALAQAEAEIQAARAQISAAEAALEQSEAACQQATAQESQASLDLEETHVYAPMDGVVSKRHLDPGAQVTAATPLYTILAMENVKVVISVPINRLSLVVPGKTKATLRTPAAPDARIPCTVEKIYPSVDIVTRTAQVELRVENPRQADGTYRMLPGIYAAVDLLLEERNDIVTVDVSLPIRNLDKQLVYVCDGDLVHAVPVTLGITTGGMVEVLEGLSAGDEIVVQGQHRLTDGSSIQRIRE